ncbi:MAG: ABC-three component system protein [Polyangiaceae bacterium]
MADPMVQSRKQQLADQQVNISFLVGLDWSVPRQWQQVRDREKSLEQIKKGMKEGAFGAVIGSAASLKSDLIIAQDRTRKLKAAVASFKVVEQYHELEREASALTKRLADLADENLLDRRYVTELEQTTVEEIPPAPDDLQRLYKEAGVLLPSLVKKRFEDVSLFHESVVRNRRAYLTAEMEAAKQRIAGRDSEKGKLDARRSEVMTVLRSAGALEHFTALQGELTKAEATPKPWGRSSMLRRPWRPAT